MALHCTGPHCKIISATLHLALLGPVNIQYSRGYSTTYSCLTILQQYTVLVTVLPPYNLTLGHTTLLKVYYSLTVGDTALPTVFYRLKNCNTILHYELNQFHTALKYYSRGYITAYSILQSYIRGYSTTCTSLIDLYFVDKNQACFVGRGNLKSPRHIWCFVTWDRDIWYRSVWWNAIPS